MRKICILCLTILLSGVFFVSGCTNRAASSQPSATPEGEEQLPEPTASPVPTPMPYDLLLQNAPPQYSFLESTDEITAAMGTIAENAAEHQTQADAEVSAASVRLTGSAAQGDIMVLDGDTLYLLAEKDLVVLRLEGEDSRVLSRTKVGADWSGQEGVGLLSGKEKIPTGLYCADGRLAIVYDCYSYEGASGQLNYTEYTGLEIFDVSDPAAPALLTAYGQDGSLRAADLTGNTLLLATEYEVFSQDGSGDDLAPSVYYNDAAAPLEAGSICFARDGWFSGFSLVGAYDLAEPRRVDVKALLGVGGDVLAAQGQVFYHSGRWAEVQGRIYDGFSENARMACTDIFRFAPGDAGLTVTAAVVNGVLPEGVSLDVRDGIVRAVTGLDQRLYPVNGAEMDYAVEEERTGTAVFLLDETLTQTGRTELDVDASEIRWVGYLTDRVIVSLADGETSIPVDISDPTAPAPGNALPAYITALAIHPWGEDACTAFSQQEAGELTLTVYDEGFNPLSQRSFGSDYSSTLENIRGYLSLAEDNVIGFSADDSYCVYGFTPEGGIVFRGDAFLQDWAWNARGFLAGENFYVADRVELCVAPKEDLEAFLSIPY